MIDNQEVTTKWDVALTSVFEGEVPDYAQWTSLEAIVSTLNGIAGRINHVFFPSGGGQALHACWANDDLLEWTDREAELASRAYVCKPTKLTFWNPGKTTREANFILETAELSPVYLSESEHDRFYEEVVEISPGEFAPRYAWDAGEFEGLPLPEGARVLVRTVRPSRFAVFCIGSRYNSDKSRSFDAYDAIHTDPEAFEAIIKGLSSQA